jgi:hypothetical protein
VAPFVLGSVLVALDSGAEQGSVAVVAFVHSASAFQVLGLLFVVAGAASLPDR